MLWRKKEGVQENLVGEGNMDNKLLIYLYFKIINCTDNK